MKKLNLAKSFFNLCFFVLTAAIWQPLQAQELKKSNHIPGAACKDCLVSVTSRNSDPNSNQNGNNTDNTSYTNTGCGINWTQGTVVLQQRAPSAGLFTPPPGATQPAPVVISGIPACATIVKAFLYADASGNGVPITATVVNPGGSSANFPMTIIGTDVDKCWSSLSYAGTYSYRADVTTIVTGNGTYQLSGLPVYPAAGPNDVDGATLIIIYQDASASYTGTIVLADGAYTSIGSGTSNTINGFTACGNSTTAAAFLVVADLQQLSATTMTLNGTAYSFPGASNLWWNFVQTPTTVSAGQTTSLFSTINASDCYNIVVEGLYFQTGCSVCTAPNLTVTASSTSPCGGPNSATATATGGSGSYTYSWSSGQTSQTISGIAIGVYTVTVTDLVGCKTGTATVNVTGTGSPPLTVNSPTFCTGSSAILTASGATTYTWSPATGLSSTNGASVTANPTTTTTYTISGTMGACTGTVTSVVTVNPLPTINVTNGTVCNGASVTLTASGANTYSWSPPTGLSATTGASVTANPPSTTNYTITGTNINGCVNTNTTSVTVVTNPTVTVNTGTICIGNSTTLNAGGATTYAWSPATGLSSTTGTSVTANPVVTTVYTITGSAGTCTAVASTTVTVNPLPPVTVNSGTICIGQQTATLNASGANTYSWTPSTGLSATTGASVISNPTTTTSYTVTGTDVNGCVNTATSTVIANPIPVVTVNSGFICNGNIVTLNAGGASTYAWSPPTGLSASTGASVNANPPSTTNYTITGTDVNGCVDTETTTVTVANNPTVTVNTGTICIGNSTNLNATGAPTYAWSPATGLSATTGSTVIANPATTTVYTITGSAGTCTSVTTTTVTVNPLPVVTAGSNSPLCVNQNLNLTSSGGTNYSWSGPGTYASAQQNPTVNGVTTAAAGVYTVTVTDANTCVNKTTVNVVVNSLPVVTATGATVCIGATINLTCNNSGVVYSWSGPNTYGSNQQNPSIANAAINMSGNYVVTVTDGNGCVNTNFAQVTVNPALVIAATNNGPICQNGTLIVGANTGVSWVWNGPGGFTAVTQGQTIPNVQVSASGIYTVTGTDMNGCTGTATTAVVVNALPIITANTATICVTQQVATLTGNGASTYTWMPAATLNSSTGTTVTGTPMVTTTYTIVGTDGNGCVNFSTTTINVNQLPAVTVNNATLCIGNSATLNANGAATYTWSPATNLNTTIGASVSANPSANTFYTVTGIDMNGCFSSAISSITVNSLPVVAVNTGTICLGQTNTTLNVTGANTYSWAPLTGLNTSTGASVIATPAATTNYTVTGTDINGCVNTATTSVLVNAIPVVAVGPQITTGCAPVCVNLSNTSTVTGTCSWNLGDGSLSSSCAPSHCYTGQGTFSSVLTLTEINGCVGTASATVIVYPVPTADFNVSPQPTSILDPIIHFYDATTGAVISTWNWTFGDPNNSTASTQNPTFTYLAVGSYQVMLTVVSNKGCIDSTIKIIKIDDEFMIYVPNAFTPNYDGTNDVFYAKGEGIKDFKMYIFDRWGNQVFYSDDISKGWDGRFSGKSQDIVQEDVYVWKIELKNYKGEPRLLKGTVSLVK